MLIAIRITSDGKEEHQVRVESIMPFVRSDHFSQKKSVRMCAPLCSA